MDLDSSTIVSILSASGAILTALGALFGSLYAVNIARAEAKAALVTADAAADKATVDGLIATLQAVMA